MRWQGSVVQNNIRYNKFDYAIVLMLSLLSFGSSFSEKSRFSKVWSSMYVLLIGLNKILKVLEER